MNVWWAVIWLVVIVAALLVASHRPGLQGIFHWIPVPLWCYALPAIAVELGWLPHEHPAYRLLTDHVLPVALTLLLLGVDLPSVMRMGAQALIAGAIGTLGIVIGAPVAIWMLHPHLPPEAWKGAGALAGTWTGGTMNLLALRSVLNIPQTIFAPLIVVDAMVAYSWMALLVAASGFQRQINRWLRVPTPHVDATAAQNKLVRGRTSDGERCSTPLASWFLCLGVAFSVVIVSRCLALRLPASSVVSSASGWTILLVTTAALGLSLMPRIRRIGEGGSELGYAGLYLVLAATGAQARLSALWSTPMWIVLGLVIVTFHGVTLLVSGRLLRIPLGTLATASQANVGGVVSAPLVGAVYHQSLAPIGLLLAVAWNALGTYLGLLAAILCRALGG